MGWIAARVRAPLSAEPILIFRGSAAAALAALIETNASGTRTHICTEVVGGGVGWCRNNVRH